MKSRDGTTRVLGLSSVMTLGVITMIACGCARVAAQNPPSPGADTTALRRLVAPDSAADATAAAGDDPDKGYHRMTLEEWGARVLGPRAVLRDVATAGFSQVRGAPTEWSKNWQGYGNRLSSRLGTEAIAQTIVLGVSLARDERPAHFTLCECTGTAARFGHALLTPLNMETPQGQHFSLLAPASEIVSAILITSLLPGGFAVRAGLSGGALGIAASALGAVGREFWPFHRRPFGI
jgi:hypothetical protein